MDPKLKIEDQSEIQIPIEHPSVSQNHANQRYYENLLQQWKQSYKPYEINHSMLNYLPANSKLNDDNKNQYQQQQQKQQLQQPTVQHFYNSLQDRLQHQHYNNIEPPKQPQFKYISSFLIQHPAENAQNTQLLLQQEQQQQQQQRQALQNTYSSLQERLQHQHYGNIEPPKREQFKYTASASQPVTQSAEQNIQNVHLIQKLQQQQLDLLRYLNQLPVASQLNVNNALGTLHCLPEGSLCDPGHDEQCCGQSSFCINYWGAGKCLAFTELDRNDFSDDKKKKSNLNYKNYFNYLLQNVKNEIEAYNYATPLSSILKATFH